MEIVSMLGEPTKIKQASDGTRVLFYKLVRFATDFAPGPNALPLEIPGVGRVGRIRPERDLGFEETVTVAPTDHDEEGRPVAGGVSTTQSVRTTWNSETRRAPRAKSHVASRGIGKIRLKFVLDPGGIVSDWSVSEK